ncbi:MAG: hypothetical protein HC764_23930 [Pleurocapsa sp. CRU_1_2]|nr:hypothetical protein [Pleurocapsa sp. CRU_1_2]
MTWDETGSYLITQKETVIEANFTSRLAIKTDQYSLLKTNWNWAGYLNQYLTIPDLGLVRVEEKINLSTRETILFVPSYAPDPYQLKLFKADWIPSFTLTIYEDSMPLNSYSEVNIPNPNASTTNSTAVPISATSVSFLAANANRKRLIVANNSNQDLYIDFDATAAVADHTIKIPRVSAGGQIFTYELDHYTGVVSGIWGAAGAGAALVKEMV